MKNQNLDQVILVDEQDQQIGVLDKVEAHRHPAQLHRASSVFLFRRNKENEVVQLLLQQRSKYKIVGALQWANTVCVNLRPGETYHSAAVRRLEEELGITGVALTGIQLQDLDTFRYQVKCNQEFGENEIDHIFVGWDNLEWADEVKDNSKIFSPNELEVRAINWVDWQTIQNAEYNLAPWFKLMLQDSILIEKINSWLQK